ncbi:MAG: FAD-dependent oxidoreductase [Pseudomonadota bacterium]
MSLQDIKTVAILGAGQAGGQAAVSLRQYGFEGRIVLVGDEAAPPYQRPPLSKAYMKGELPEERLYLRPLDYYESQSIEMKLDIEAKAIDRSARKIALSDGTSLDYDALIVALGSRPRKLPSPGADLPQVFDLRTLSDVDKIKPLMTEGAKLVVVGAGYIGLEAAAVARTLGLEVTVLEAAPRVLARVTGEDISNFYQDAHRGEGVDIRLNAKLESFEGDDKLTGVKLAGGEVLAADIALVGVGIVPNEEIAADAGLACDNGIIVDRDARTNDPRVFAAGDCARRPLVHYGRDMRLESVHNAIEQGKLAAAAICGKDRPAEEAPWFWSDQYDLKLQTVGLMQGADETVIRGDPATRKFAVFYLKDGRLIAVDAVNSPPEFLGSKKLVARNVSLAPEELRDTSISIKEIATKALADAPTA